MLANQEVQALESEAFWTPEVMPEPFFLVQCCSLSVAARVSVSVVV